MATMRHRTDAEIADMAAQLCHAINSQLRRVTECGGFANAHRSMFPIVADLAPGWQWIETTEPGDASPTVSLINPPKDKI